MSNKKCLLTLLTAMHALVLPTWRPKTAENEEDMVLQQEVETRVETNQRKTGLKRPERSLKLTESSLWPFSFQCLFFSFYRTPNFA